MKFFSNNAINRVYMHSGLQSLAYNSGGVFIYVYLLKAGVAVHLALAVLAMVLGLRLILRFMVMPVIKVIGLRNGIILGTAIDALGYLMLGHVSELGPMLVAFVFVSSLGTTFYWTCYHACVARLGDEEHRGSQVSAREAIFAITGIIGPIAGGLMLTFFGPVYAFALTAALNCAGIIPLLGVPRLDIEPEARLPLNTKLFAFGLAFSDGLVASSVNMIWRVVLFQTLGESFQAYGGALALAGVFGALMGLGVGRMIDLGHHKRSIQIGLVVMASTILVGAFGYHHSWSAIAANMIGAAAAPLYLSAIMTQFYNVGKASSCTLRFNIAGENGFDSGSAVGCTVAELFLWAGLQPFWPLLAGLAGIAGEFVILRRRDNQKGVPSFLV
ncbi:MAG: MFS transporter [Aestuariivirga sp.]